MDRQEARNGPLHLGLISAWPWDIVRGSGTARFLIELEHALLGEGIDVVRMDADLDPSDYAAFVARRLEWNRALRGDPRLGGLDAVLALDWDGFDLPPPPAGPAKVACPQAVFADLAATEPEPFRGLLLAQADAEGRNVRSAQAVICPSRYAADGVARAYGVAPERIAVVPHGFNHAEWSAMLSDARRVNGEASRASRSIRRDRAGRPFPSGGDRTRTVLAVAKLYPRKGIDLLLEAVAILIRSRPDLRVRIVGGGIDLDRLVRLSITLGLESIVCFEGDEPDRRRLAARFADADLFCLPSRHETFGFVFVEAMAAGLPVVALDAGAAPEVVADAGRLVPAGDPAALASAMGAILDDPELAGSLVEKGLKQAARFTWPAAVERYLAVIRTAVRASRE